MFPEYLTDDLILTIEEWYDDREIVDDTKFGLYLNRVLNRDYARYVELLRLEPGISKYDWLVNRYNEWRTWGTDNTSDEGKHTKEYGMTLKRQKGTADDTLVTASGGDYKEHTEYGGSDENVINARKRVLDGSTTPNAGSTKTAKAASVDKNNPYSVSYEGAAAGSIPALDWSTSSTQAQTETSETIVYDGGSDKEHTEETESGGDTTKYGQTRDTYASGSKTTKTESKTTGADDDIYGGSDTDKDESKTGFDTDRYHMESGRTGDPVPMLKDAVEFIKKTSSWQWLASRLEICFMGVFDY